MEHLDAFYRGRAQAQGHPGGRTGGITFVQRAGSSLNLCPRCGGRLQWARRITQ